MSTKIIFIVVSAALILHSCTKKNEANEAGITYGITGVEPMIAGTGDTVNVFGVGFAPDVSGNNIVINGVKATVVSAKSDVLRVVIPDAPRKGTIEVKTGSSAFTYESSFTPISVIKGDLIGNITWTPDRLYELKGDVHLRKDAKLTVQPGCIIFGDKQTLASLTVDDGATIVMNGSEQKPIVFTSNQLINQRMPGDWKGIVLAGSSVISDQMSYVRIEYAGYHLPTSPGAALLVNRGIAAGNLRYVQISYSMGDGFRIDAPSGSVQYLQNLLALGCAGNDFSFIRGARGIGQFLLGMKDPLYADVLGADGLLVRSSQLVTISNLTLVGYNGLARGANFRAPDQENYNGGVIYDDALNPAAGRGIHVGGPSMNGQLQLFNSLVAAPWLAGISLDGPAAWAGFDDAATGTIIRKTTFTYTLASSSNSQNHPANLNPLRGYVFSKENISSPTSGFEGVDAAGPQLAAFRQYNDSTKLMLVYIPYTPSTQVYDDAGIRNMVLYNRITNPVMEPQTGSALLSGADFSGSWLNDNFFDKSIVFRGAIGTLNWTATWANFIPQTTAY